MRFLLLFLCAILFGCGTSQQADVSGNWTGMLNSNSAGDSRSLDLFITQTGTTLSGPRLGIGDTQSFHLCDFAGTMSGTTNGSKVTMTLVIPPNPTLANLNQTVVLTGNAQAGSFFSGSYNTTAGCLEGDSGTFLLSNVPSITSSQWSGTWSAFGAGGTASANLNEDASANFTGTLIMGSSDGTCICDGLESGIKNVSGSLTGRNVDLVVHIPEGNWSIPGSLDYDGKTLRFDRMCADAYYHWMNITLTRP